MVTIANANFPDSDHDDEDFEDSGAVEAPTPDPTDSKAQRKRSRKRQKNTEDLWKEMQQEETENAKGWVKRPCPDPSLYLGLERGQDIF